MSPTGAERDRLIKRKLYADSGVREYWLVDDASKSVEVLSLSGQEYTPFGYFVDSGEREPDVIRSAVLRGFACPCAEVFRSNR